MFKKLQAKWNVNLGNLLLIISTFAIGGSLCGFAGRKILLLTNLEKNIAWFLLYIILITILWPFSVLIVSIPLGQFSFFKKYILKIRNKMMLRNAVLNNIHQINLAIFASGAGTNAKKIIEHFKNDHHVKIELIVSNKSGAGVIQIAKDNNIDQVVINKDQLIYDSNFIRDLEKRKIDFIILAGFLLKIPPALIQSFPKKIINIHPALLPAYGGKGMYGMHVHETVIANKEKQSGISIHYVDEIYDHGEIIFQATCNIDPADTAEDLAKKIHLLEYTHYPAVIETVLKNQKAS
ncbi:MAG: phosphoribosylglycinamide formyltransferase [Ferruginibacter sp.]